MVNFDQFKAEWLGRRVGDPLLVGNGETAATMYQCVSLIKQYWTECDGIVVDWPGNAIDLWAHTNSTILTKFSRIETNEVQKSDIVVLKTNGYNDYTEPGHVMISTGGINATQFEGLEQNGQTGGGTGTGGDAIRTRWVNRSRVAGVLRPFAQAPAAPAPVVHPYTIEAITSKVVKLNKLTHRWGLNYDNLAAIEANPQDGGNPGDLHRINAILHHNIGLNYYLEDPNVASGYNVVDCDDVPVPVLAHPFAPLPIPTPQKYTLKYEVNGYNTATDAGSGTNPVTKMIPQDYFVFNTYPNKPNLINISTDNQKAGAWIDTDDDVAPLAPPVAPTPEPIQEPTPQIPDTDTQVRMSLMWFMPDHSAIECKVLKNVMVTELFNKRSPIELSKGKEVKVFGTLTKDGRTYALMRLGSDLNFEYLYGVAVKSHVDLLPYLDDIYSYADKIKYGFERAVDSAVKTIDGIFKPKRR